MLGMQIGMDLGSSCITAYVKGKGIVLREANAIAYDRNSGDVLAVGNEAEAMLDRTPDTVILKQPMRDGVISDFSVQCEILTALLQRVCRHAVFRPNLVISAPGSLSALERRTILNAACAGGAARVSVLEETIASALGAGVSVDAPHGVLVVDIGAGATDISVITMGTVAFSRSLPLAGDDFDTAICRYLRRVRGIEIGLPTARRLKHRIGCAAPREEEFEAAANGKDAVRQMPLQFTVTSTELCEALQESVKAIADAVISVLDEVPPELYADICEDGVVLCGGSSGLYGLDKALAGRLRLPVKAAPDGAHCAAKGAGYALQNMRKLEDHGFFFRLKERNIS